jgi:flagellin
MGVVVNTNVPSLAATRILSVNRAGLETAMERLSSGKRINSSSDDAAGMAVAAKLKADVRSLNQAIRNINDAISLVNTYDGAATEVEAMIVRVRELATQSANGTYSNDDRKNAHEEVKALIAEIDRIAENTQFNRTSLSDGDKPFKFRVGAQGADDDVDFTLKSLATKDLGIDDVKVDTAANATAALTDVDSGLDALALRRAIAGAFVNRLSHTIIAQQNASQRTTEALSGIEDADYAAESAALARGMVLAQAGTAMLAQANMAQDYILYLILK